MSDLISVRVSETGANPFAVMIDMAAHRLVGDEPVAAGGADLRPSPY